MLADSTSRTYSWSVHTGNVFQFFLHEIMSHGTPVHITHTPELELLLSKLRPFQRAAFDFAVHGVSIEEKDGNKKYSSRGDDRRYTKPSCNRSLQKEGSIVRELEKSVSIAGAGTGRILLGDEVSFCIVCVLLC